MGKKKEIEIQHEFIKFIKSLYSDEIQLNMMDSFDLSYNGKDVELFFPKNKFFKMVGTLNIDEMPKFKEWFTQKESSLHFDNALLDDVRKKKMADFESVATTENKYTIKFTDGSTYELKRNKPFMLTDTFDGLTFKYKVEIPVEKFDKDVFVMYFKNEKILFKNMQDSEVLLDIAVKDFYNIFKKEAKYELSATDKNTDGFRYVKLTATGEKCSLTQYFKVI
jgi:hypothetical protein